MPLILNFLKIMAGILLCVFILHHQTGAQNESFKQVSSDTTIATDIVSGVSSPFTCPYKKVDSTELNLTVFPANGSMDKAPAIVFFFGGGWEKGTVHQFKTHAQYFARRGMTGILVDYRVSSRHNTTPFEAVEDAGDAVKFIVRHADSFGIDEQRMILSGGSAGGHLALMSSFSPEFEPAALVLFNPVIDTGPDGYGYGRIGEGYKAISPVDNIPEDPPPMIMFQGSNDKIVSVAQAEGFCHAVSLKGGRCSVKLYRGQGHGFFNYENTEYFIQTVREADQFLVRQHLLEGEPDIEEWMNEMKLNGK